MRYYSEWKISSLPDRPTWTGLTVVVELQLLYAGAESESGPEHSQAKISTGNVGGHRSLSVRPQESGPNPDSNSLAEAVPDLDDDLAVPREPQPGSGSLEKPVAWAGAHAETGGVVSCVSDTESEDGASCMGEPPGKASSFPSASPPAESGATGRPVAGEGLLVDAVGGGVRESEAAAVDMALFMGRSPDEDSPKLPGRPGDVSCSQNGAVATRRTIIDTMGDASSRGDSSDKASPSTSKPRVIFGAAPDKPAASWQLLQSTAEEGRRSAPRNATFKTDVSQVHTSVAEGSGGLEKGSQGMPQGSWGMEQGPRGLDRHQDVGLLGDLVSALEVHGGAKMEASPISRDLGGGSHIIPDSEANTSEVDGQIGSSQMGRYLGCGPHIIPDSEADIAFRCLEHSRRGWKV